jgi:hypothetical protein
MNSGLPSLLDAIFGKQDLASVSLDEMYDLIKEFPSFNAAHYLLAKKLRQRNDAAFEKESMRTALYFNNPFWLQSLLDEGNDFNQAGRISSVKDIEEEDEDEFQNYHSESPVKIAEAKKTFEEITPDPPVGKEELENTFQKNVPELPPVVADELDEETEEILDEKNASESVPAYDAFQYAEPGPETVKSFDELMSKYKIEPLDMVDETAAGIHDAIQDKSEGNSDIETILESDADLFISENAGSFSEEGTPQEKYQSFQDAGSKENEVKEETVPDPNDNEFETREEVVNEYGIFEELVVRKKDHDLDVFDRPFDETPMVSEKIAEEIIAAEKSTGAENTWIDENSSIVENKSLEDTPDKTDEHDYDAFDRPVEINEPEFSGESNHIAEIFEETLTNEADDTDEPEIHHEESEIGQNGQMQHLSDRFEEQQKSLAAFNAKNTDSIVFTPYHMVDYFASQGIKLVLEDNPPDQFGKQLKSFTDWLKVMKKLPIQPSLEKSDEKEADKIRHFASHSIEERDVLTESMAEVLAKQGMYENAISLYQKLSLIYPPKSAYFASRIEQLKASLP